MTRQSQPSPWVAGAWWQRIERLAVGAGGIDAAGRAIPKPPIAQTAGLSFLYCVTFIILHGLTNFYPLARLAASPWNPETGLTVAASVLLGRPIIFLALASHIIADWTTRAAPFATVELPASICYALAYAVPGTFIRRWLHDFGHDSMRFLLRFLTLTLFVAFLFAGSQASFAILIRNIPASELLSPAFTLAVGDIIGVLTVAPLFLFTLRDTSGLKYFRENTLVLTVATACIVAISLGVFGLDVTDDFKFFYVLFVPIIVLAVVQGLNGAIFGVLITDASMMAIIYWREVTPSTATELQLLMTSLSITGLTLGTTVHERGLFKRALTLSQKQLSQSQSLLLHSSRVAVVSEMTTALAHELNQPLSAIKVYMRALQRVIFNEDPAADKNKAVQLFDEAVAQVDHAASLIRRTRNFLRRGEKRIRKANLRNIISTSLALTEAEMRAAGIHLSVDVPKSIPPVWASDIQAQQVIVNLIRNAKDAIEAGPKRNRRITIAAAIDPARAGCIRVSIADSGGGVPAEFREQLFQPFATTKGDGLGLGLALCRTIISAHGGEIWLDDSADMTCFAFTLRIHQVNDVND